ncbi:hypothetical protein RHS01_09488 [Rhizoctonia solani]|uniref:Uncharacterized protein n=1 Tax=Rhizoctonia solani TaxID=456999 RepID=A0A8H7I3F6_9AGAM|nr:hypothetical protein RHS01_09488 [Rhizoctonia solani]
MRVSNKKIKLRLAAKKAHEEYLRRIKSQSQDSPELTPPDNQSTETLNHGSISTVWPRQSLEEPPAAIGSGSGMATTFQTVILQISSSPPTLDMEPESSAINQLPTIQEAKNALEKVSDAIQTPNQEVATCTTSLTKPLKTDTKGFMVESLIAARGQCRTPTYAQSIQRWIQQLIATGDLPYFKHGWWIVPLLRDEDIGHEIKAHLQEVGKQACAKAIVNFFSDTETQTCLGVSKPISLRTAQHWMSKYGGFCWQKEPKGQYFDGHKQANVVDYCQKTYVPFMQDIEQLTRVYNKKGTLDPQHPILLHPGEKPTIVWFHNKSVFFANDRWLVRWVGANKHPTPFKKGEGSTIMIADFVSAQLGWLQGNNGKSARVILRLGINRNGYFTCARVVEQLENAIRIVQEAFPKYAHIFVYDNAPSHTKHPEDAISARTMPKGEVEYFPCPYTVKGSNGTSQRVTPP